MGQAYWSVINLFSFVIFFLGLALGKMYRLKRERKKKSPETLFFDRHWKTHFYRIWVSLD